jgi:Carboxypeptidase regulatory-like domain/TonB-dependent Receptor Plug Domain
MRMRLGSVLVLLTALAIAPRAWSDGSQSGSIGGTVRDAAGGPLPGAAVTAKSVTSGFTRDTVTAANGSYGIRLLPIGEYAVTVALSGFGKIATTVVVETEKNTQFDTQLKMSAISETVNVSAEQPVIDKTQTNTQTTVDSKFTQKLAVGRSYQSVLQLAPGVTGGANPNVHGALNQENIFLFDGVDTTDTTTGTFGQNFNYEAIQEVNVNTGNFSAEYGRASGGVIQVVTKSGGNEYHGSVKALATNDQWNGQNYQKNQTNGASLERPIFDEVQWREAATLGGRLIRDRLWFFGSYEYAKTTTPALQTLAGDNYQQATTAKIWSAKATWAINNQHTLEASGNGDPITGFVVDYWGGSADLQALTGQDQGGHVYRGSYQGVFSSSFSLEALGASSASRIDVLPFNGASVAPFFKFNGANVATTQVIAPHYDLSQNIYFNGATFVGFVDRPRTQFGLAANYYKQLGGSNHNFKVGFDYQKLESGASFAYPGDAVYYDDSFNKTTREFAPNELNVFAPPAPSTSKGNVYGLYLLDKIDMGRLFVNVGVRVDKQDGSSDVGNTVFDKTVFSPRISFKFDLAGNGKMLVSGGYGRFYQSLIQAFEDGFAAIPQQGIYDDYFYNAATGKYDFSSHVDLGGNSTPVNLGLKPSYSDDLTLAFEQQVGRSFGFSVRGTYRRWSDLIDDVKTLTNGVRSLQYVNYDGASRLYRGLEFVLDKRFANNWQALLSYTLSRTEGNTFPSGGGIATALGDYLANVSSVASGSLTGAQVNEGNKYGVSPYDRTHDIKGYGAYTMPVGPARITLGSTLGLRSGVPNQQQRTVNIAGANYTQFVTPRGSDRFPWQFYWDMALQADVTLWKEVALGIKGEAFNLTDTQTQLAGSTSTNPALYGLATSRTQFATPRNFRLTALLTF